MSKFFRKVLTVLFLGVLIGLMPIKSVVAATASDESMMTETSVETGNEASDGQEIIEDEEVPLAAPIVNTTVFMWCGIAMVVVLASITGYASFGKEETAKR